MIINIIASVKNLIFTDLPDKIDFLHFDLKSSPDVFNQEYLTSEYSNAAGIAAIKEFQAHPYFHLKDDFPSEANNALTESEVEHIIRSSRHMYTHLEAFIMCLWFVRDNSCYVGAFHAFAHSDDRLVTINTSDSMYSNCQGTFKDKTTFNLLDLNRALAFYVKYNEARSLQHIDFVKPEDRPKPFQTVRSVPYNYSQITRVERAFHFLKLARGSVLLPRKIAFYMCIYECLFSPPNKAELSHTLAERIALYIEYIPGARKETYAFIKEAYNIRSHYFHGQELKGKAFEPSKLEALSFRLDALTRNVLSKVIMEDSNIFNQSSEKLEESFKDLLFAELDTYGITVEEKPNHERFSHVKANYFSDISKLT